MSQARRKSNRRAGKRPASQISESPPSSNPKLPTVPEPESPHPDSGVRAMDISREDGQIGEITPIKEVELKIQQDKEMELQKALEEEKQKRQEVKNGPDVRAEQANLCEGSLCVLL